MTTIDIILGMVVLGGVIFGLARGPVKELVSLAVACGSGVAALYFYPKVARLTGSFFTYPDASLLFGFLASFFVPIFTAGLIMFIIARVSKSGGVPFSHRLVGGILGVLRGGVVAGVLLLALLAFPLKSHPLDRSAVLPKTIKCFRTARGVFPTRVAENVEKEITRIEKGEKAGGEDAAGGRKQK